MSENSEQSPWRGWIGSPSILDPRLWGIEEPLDTEINGDGKPDVAGTVGGSLRGPDMNCCEPQSAA